MIIGIGNFIGSKSSGAYSFFASVDRAIAAGVGPSVAGGYISFLETDNDPDDPNIIYIFLRSGSDHNSTAATSKITGMRSTDGGVTWSAQFDIITNLAGFNLTNASCQVIKSGANKGRVIVNASKQRAPLAYEIVGPSDVVTRYSDDLKSVVDPATAAWSAVANMFPDYGEKNTTSTTSIDLGAVGATQSLTVATGLTNIYVGRRVRIASNANANNRITGRVQSYTSGTGALVVDNITVGGAGTLTDWNVSFSSYIDSVGKAITLPDNSLLKVVHWTEGLGFNGYVLTSTDGITWTFKGTVWNVSSDGNADSHEGSLARHPNGDIYCFRRNSLLGLIIYSKSTDAGATWSTRVHTNIDNVGKCPFIITDRGNIAGMGRDVATGRTTIWQSNNNGATFNRTFIDGRTGVYMYGGIVRLASGVLKYIYSVEAPNVPLAGSSGPCVIVQKDVIESIPTISAPTVYDVEYQGLLDFAQGNGETVPSDANKAIDNTCVVGMRSDGDLTELDEYWLGEYNNTALELMSRRSWRRPWLKLSPTNTPTLSTTGWTFNGTSNYYTLPILLSTTTKYIQDSASCFFYLASDVASDLGTCLGTSGGTHSTHTNALIIRPRTTTNTPVVTINDGSQDNVAGANTNSIGFYQALRTASNSKKLIKNGVDLISVTTASTGKTSTAFTIGCGRWVDNVFRFWPGTIGSIGIGSGSVSESRVRARMATRRTALGL